MKTSNLEIERRFLVKFPSSWANLAKLFDHIIDIKRISQTYLIPEPGKQAARVRKTIEGLSGNLKTKYDYNRKKPTGETGVHQELENPISEKDYSKYLKKSNPNKQTVEKIRFVFKWHDQVFELDLFKGHLKGLVIL